MLRFIIVGIFHAAASFNEGMRMLTKSRIKEVFDLERSTRKGLQIIIWALFFSIFAISASAIAENGAPEKVMISLSLSGTETKGITYTLMGITRHKESLEVNYYMNPMKKM